MIFNSPALLFEIQIYFLRIKFGTGAKPIAQDPSLVASWPARRHFGQIGADHGFCQCFPPVLSYLHLLPSASNNAVAPSPSPAIFASVSLTSCRASANISNLLSLLWFLDFLPFRSPEEVLSFVDVSPSTESYYTFLPHLRKVLLWALFWRLPHLL